MKKTYNINIDSFIKYVKENKISKLKKINKEIYCIGINPFTKIPTTTIEKVTVDDKTVSYKLFIESHKTKISNVISEKDALNLLETSMYLDSKINEYYIIDNTVVKIVDTLDPNPYSRYFLTVADKHKMTDETFLKYPFIVNKVSFIE